MNYSDGKKINVGDRVELWNNKFGYVACSIDDGIYTEEFSRTDWAHLKKGVIVKMDDGQVMHYAEPDFDLKICG